MDGGASWSKIRGKNEFLESQVFDRPGGGGKRRLFFGFGFRVGCVLLAGGGGGSGNKLEKGVAYDKAL